MGRGGFCFIPEKPGEVFERELRALVFDAKECELSVAQPLAAPRPSPISSGGRRRAIQQPALVAKFCRQSREEEEDPAQEQQREFLFVKATLAKAIPWTVQLALACGTQEQVMCAPLEPIDFRAFNPVLFQNAPAELFPELRSAGADDGGELAAGTGFLSSDDDDDGGGGGGKGGESARAAAAEFADVEKLRVEEVEDALALRPEEGTVLLLDSAGDLSEDEPSFRLLTPDAASPSALKAVVRTARVHLLGGWTPRCELVWCGFRISLEDAPHAPDSGGAIGAAAGLKDVSQASPRFLMTVSPEVVTKSANKK